MSEDDHGREPVSASGGRGSIYTHLVENIQDAVVEFQFVDGEPIVRRVNSSFEETFGYDAADIRGESLNDWIVPPESEGRAETIDGRTADGERTSQQLTRQTADGPREFLHRSIPCEGPIDGIALYTDITERERAKQKRQLIAETSRCIGTAETLRDGFETTLRAICDYTEWVCGEVWQPVRTDDELAFVVGHSDSPAYESFLTASEDVTFAAGEGLPGRVYASAAPEWMTDVSDVPAEVFHRTDLAGEVGLRAAFAAPVLADGDCVAVLVFFLRERRGTDRLLAQHVTDVAGHLGGLVARKQAEEKVRYRNHQLEKLTNMLSHDLRNPLTVILGRLGHIDVPDEQEQHLAAIERSATRMEGMITGLLEMARSGQEIETLEPVSLAAVVADSWNNVRSDGLTLDCRVPEDVLVDADRDRLLSVFENLFHNAREHNDTPLTVRVGTLGGTTGQPLGFFVEDDGVGVPAHVRDEVFEYGYTDSTSGTGIGLAIVKEAVQAHGWSISLTDGRDGGARFEVRTNGP